MTGVYDGLSPDCAACHGPGSGSPYFGSFEEFQQLVVNDAAVITAGDPENSILIRVMEGNGDAPWAMPLGARNYRQMSLKRDRIYDGATESLGAGNGRKLMMGRMTSLSCCWLALLGSCRMR